MSILVILVHHAKSLEGGQAYGLSDEGKKMQSKVNAFLKELEIAPTEIWTSPALSASETARMIGREYGQEPKEIDTLGELEMFDEVMINEQLKEMPDESTVVIVSHPLQMMRLASFWLGYQYFAEAPPASSALFLVFRQKAGPQKVGPNAASIVRFITYADLLFGTK